MSLRKQLISEMKTAMKAGDKTKLGVIRYLRSQIKNYEIDHGKQDEAGLQQIVAKEVKQVKESIHEYRQAGREDLVEAEEAKLEVLSTYLPEQLSDQELKKIVQEVIDQVELSEPGPVIGQVMARVKNQADGARVSQLVRELMSQQS
jgi:hypothetical protein